MRIALALRVQMAGDSDRVRELERELKGAQSRIRTLDAKIAANLARERRAQQRLANAERLSSRAMLAAGASRSLRGPLQYAALNLEYVVGELMESQEAADDFRHRLQGPLAEARDSLRKLDDILNAIDGDPPEPEGKLVTEDLRRVLLSSIRMARGLTAANVRISTEFEQIPPVVGSELRLAEVFFHLMMNACEAVARQSGSDPHVRVATRNDLQRILVSITDTGPGIPPEDRQHIFEPFFTSKTAGAAGLGLALCRHLLRQMDAEVTFETHECAGTTFTVCLQRATEDQSAPPESAVRFVTTKPPIRRLGSR